LILVAGLGTPAFAGGPQVTLADLLAGQSIVFGDKEFKNFRNFVSNSNGANASPVDPAFIEVNPISVSNEVGLEFSSVFLGPSGEMFIGGESDQQTFFEFDVVVLDPNLAIHDNTLEFGSSPNAIFGAGTIGISSLLIQETVEDALGQDLVEKEVFADTVANFQNPDHKTFPPQSEITVSVNIELAVASSAGQSVADDIRITFSQTEIATVGGEFLPIDSTALLVAAAQSPAAWLSSLTLVALGIGAYVFTRNPNNIRNIKVILRDYLDRL